MPYKRKGRIIYHKVRNRWLVKQTCKNEENAKQAIRLLNMLENK
jgi:hypothetical protein